MYPIIDSKTYWADRAMENFRHWLASVGIGCAP